MSDLKNMTQSDLEREHSELLKLKAWGIRFFELDRELRDRATREWVHQDVFEKLGWG